MKPDNLENLKLGGVGIIPTDTIYGIVGQAFRPKVVDRIYDIKGRQGNKPFIILISSLEDLKKFKVYLSEEDKTFLLKCWPGAVSVILSVLNPDLQYLHRGENTLAFRWPNKVDLVDIIKEVGPLVAPSANPEGEKPAITISEAKAYFGHNVDFYEDGGILESEPSTLIRLTKNEVEVLRVGKATVPIHDMERIEKIESTTTKNPDLMRQKISEAKELIEKPQISILKEETVIKPDILPQSNEEHKTEDDFRVVNIKRVVSPDIGVAKQTDMEGFNMENPTEKGSFQKPQPAEENHNELSDERIILAKKQPASRVGVRMTNQSMSKKEKIFYTILFLGSLLILLICILIRL